MGTWERNWSVLLIGGQSGAGKSVAAAAIGREGGIPWLQVDDFRLALQRSQVTLPRDTAALYFFDETPAVWRLPPERLCDALIAIGEAMAPALEIVTGNHVAIDAPVVIEGDGILPAFFTRQAVRQLVAAGQVRGVFLVEPDESALLANMLARGRGLDGRDEAGLRVEARAKWLYGQWLAAEARRRGLPVLAPRPWATLVERILAAASSGAA
jgi:2-phosphoglycerate kinase